MSWYVRCKHCGEKIIEGEEMRWATDCDVCGSEFTPSLFREENGLFVRLARNAEPIVGFKQICDECRESLEAAIKTAVTAQSEQRKGVTA